MCQQIKASAGPVPLALAFRSMTADIISEYIFGRSLGLMEREDWGRPFCDAYRNAFIMGALVRQLPWLFMVLGAFPDRVMLWMSPKTKEVLDHKRGVERLTKDVLRMSPEDVKRRDIPTIVWELALSNMLPPQERTFERVAAEGHNILGAGFETTGNILTHLTYHVLADDEAHNRLAKELAEAIPDPDLIPSYATLEKLPYLTAVIKETLR